MSLAWGVAREVDSSPERGAPDCKSATIPDAMGSKGLGGLVSLSPRVYPSYPVWFQPA